jgi:hypothetical protein
MAMEIRVIPGTDGLTDHLIAEVFRRLPKLPQDQPLQMNPEA